MKAALATMTMMTALTCVADAMADRRCSRIVRHETKCAAGNRFGGCPPAPASNRFNADGGVLGMAGFFKVIAAVPVLTVAAASAAEAVSIGWVPASDRFGGGGGELSIVESIVEIASIMLIGVATMFGTILTAAVVIKAAEISQDMLSFLWHLFRHRKQEKGPRNMSTRAR